MIGWLYSLCVLLFINIGCEKKGYLENLLPDYLAGMELQEVKLDQEAKEIIDQLHGKKVSGKENIIGLYYGNSAIADLYVSSFEDTLTALKVFHGMMRGVCSDTINYRDFVLRLIHDKMVVVVLSMGRVNYIYNRGKDVFWLQTDATIAENAIQELILLN